MGGEPSAPGASQERQRGGAAHSGADHEHAMRGGGAAARRLKGANEHEGTGGAKPGWLDDWEEEWGDIGEWGEELRHVVKLAVYSPITTWGILGQAILGSSESIDASSLEDDEEYRRLEHAAASRQPSLAQGSDP